MEEGRQKRDQQAVSIRHGRGREAPPGAMSRFADLLLRLPRYSVLAWNMLRDERIDQGKKAVLWAGVIYLASPIDLVPGIIPIAGQVDDLAAILLALRTVLGVVPAPLADEQLSRAGVSREDIDFDLRSLGLVAAWLVRRVGSLALRGVGAAAGAVARRARLPWGERQPATQ